MGFKPITTFEEAAMELTKKEGGKKQINIAQMRDILSAFCEMYYEQVSFKNCYPTDFELMLEKHGKKAVKDRKRAENG